ncbi:MAG: glycosyltransferase family 2 protein [Candidatus Fermentibacteraceae bacterium]|nr:glycosyltransferase family 2 protein [Candidatus Fermentibacteraceae bacterium]
MSTGNKVQITVVIPAYNEAESLPELLQEIGSALGEHAWNSVVIDDGSSDKTWKTVTDLSTRYPLKGLRFGVNRGKAAALAAGFDHADGEFIATLDADLQDDPAEILPMIELMEQDGFDLVSGWKKVRHDPAGKRLPSKLFNGVVGLTTGIHLHDFNCGLKVYRSAAAKTLDLYGEMHRYTPVLAFRNGFKVGEKTVNHRVRKHGYSKYGIARFFRGYTDLITVLFLGRYSFRPLHFFGGIGTVLSFAGLVINIYLSVLWLGGEAIGKRPLLLMGVFLMLAGFQFISMGLLGEMILRFNPRKPYTITSQTK